MVRLHCWLQQQLNQNCHSRLLSWHDKKQKIVAIKWKHASYQDYDVADSDLFKAWAQENGHFDSNAQESKDEMKRWKTNFRCALQSTANVIKAELNGSSKRNKQSRYYKLLDEPDPVKLSRKRKENRNAIKSKKKPKEQRRQYRSRKVNSRVRNESETTVSDRDPGSSDESQETELARPAVLQLYDEDPASQGWQCNTTEAAVVDRGYASDGSLHYDTLESTNVAMEVETEMSSDSDYGSCHDDDYETLQSRVWGHCGIIQETPNVVVEKIPNSVELGLQEVTFANL